jgi:hypothetical protein
MSGHRIKISKNFNAGLYANLEYAEKVAKNKSCKKVIKKSYRKMK